MARAALYFLSVMTAMLKNARNPEAFGGCYMGCSCHNTPQTRRAAKKRAKQKERRIWRRQEGLA